MDSDSLDIEKTSSSGSGPGTAPTSIALQRTRTHQRQHAETVGSVKPPKLQSYSWSIGAGKPFPEQLPASDRYLVDFDGAEDPLHPQNWTLSRK